MFSRNKKNRSRNRQLSNAKRGENMLKIESMEDRRLMAADIYLDFDGATQTQVDRACGEFTCWRDRPRSEGLVGFEQGFALRNREISSYRFLDFNNDGRLDRADGRIARNQVLNRVREDFAPYDVNIFAVSNSNWAVLRMDASATNDALIFVNGGSNAVGGQAPEDHGNRNDDVGAAGDTFGISAWVKGAYTDRGFSDAVAQDAFVNITANFISHETGHAFGLEHLDESREPTLNNRTLMDPFLPADNLGFTNVSYRTGEGDIQNEHDYLTRTIGASPNSWAAVLRPGELTVNGDNGNDNFNVRVATGNDIIVEDLTSVSVRSYSVDTSSSPDINSLNRFRSPIRSVRFNGGNGDDRFVADSNLPVMVIARGGNGNDTIYGGAAGDVLQGENGNDRIYGREGHDRIWGGNGFDVLHGNEGRDYIWGGAHSDTIFGHDGNDRIYGESGNDIIWAGAGDDYVRGGSDRDTLLGQDGVDALFGDAGNDTLDGGYDQDRDTLNGGLGNDNFIDHRRRVFSYSVFGGFTSRDVSEDLLADLTSGDRRTVRTHLWG